MVGKNEKKKRTFCGINIVWFLPPQTAAFILLATYALHSLWPASSMWIYRSLPLGALLTALGVIFIVWTLGLFCCRKTTLFPMGRASNLIIEGPFRMTRNPLYLGGVFIFAGYALTLGTPPAYLAPVAFFAAMDRLFICFEEERLLGLFGKPYADYKRRVRRWL